MWRHCPPLSSEWAIPAVQNALLQGWRPTAESKGKGVAWVGPLVRCAVGPQRAQQALNCTFAGWNQFLYYAVGLVVVPAYTACVLGQQSLTTPKDAIPSMAAPAVRLIQAFPSSAISFGPSLLPGRALGGVRLRQRGGVLER